VNTADITTIVMGDPRLIAVWPRRRRPAWLPWIAFVIGFALGRAPRGFTHFPSSGGSSRLPIQCNSIGAADPLCKINSHNQKMSPARCKERGSNPS